MTSHSRSKRLQILAARIPALHVVGTASDGAQALRLAEALSPDLLLLDMTMPEADGLTVARTLAANKTCPAVIFVTAHDQFAVEAFDCEGGRLPAETGIRRAPAPRNRARPGTPRRESAP